MTMPHPFYSTFELLPDDPILGIPLLYEKDSNPSKVNLGIGSYHDEQGNPYVLHAVRQAEKALLLENLNKEYAPISGNERFNALAIELVLGHNHPVLLEKRIAVMQTIGASGALHLSGEILVREGIERIYLPVPTWSNHKSLFEHAGLHTETYSYMDKISGKVLIDDIIAAIGQMPPKSAILLQASCHNPSGCDPSESDWNRILQAVLHKSVLPVFDLAYQGLGKGLDEDAAPIRLFAKHTYPMISVSHSKNFGLYGERLGILGVVLPDASMEKNVMSHMKQHVRGNYSSPPLQGARIVQNILDNPVLKAEWHAELAHMRNRIMEMRSLLANGLQSRHNEISFKHIADGFGFFCFCGLNKDQVMWLRNSQGVYFPESGRINIAGLNHQNIGYVIDSLIMAFKA